MENERIKRAAEMDKIGRDIYSGKIVPILEEKYGLKITNYDELIYHYSDYDVRYIQQRKGTNEKKQIKLEIKYRNVFSSDYNDIMCNKDKFIKLKKGSIEDNDKRNFFSEINKRTELTNITYLFCAIFEDNVAYIWSINNTELSDLRESTISTRKNGWDENSERWDNMKVFFDKNKGLKIQL